ncbi:MAG TPA: PLD nuclease N-terminal domain-containing protein [Ornithinibacter sp.]|nr:PLD nuclease N-terminal domain-containing protein [Ornithinibacter sp.]
MPRTVPMSGRPGPLLGTVEISILGGHDPAAGGSSRDLKVDAAGDRLGTPRAVVNCPVRAITHPLTCNDAPVIRYFPVLLELALTVYCLIDAIQTDELVIRNLPKMAWIFIILLFPIVGGVAWLVAGRPTRDTRSGRTQQQRWEDHRREQEWRREQERGRSRGPDDDPDFLKGI